ncbi:MAG: hypothetical protein WBV82_23095 [Myxococcaceae bacterium]
MTRGVTAVAVIGAAGLWATGCGGETRSVPTVGIQVGAVTGPTSEAGGQATFTVVLGSQPRAPVTVHLDSSDKSEGLVQPTELNFTPEDWRAPQTVTVTGVDDKQSDRAQQYQVVFSATTTADASYAAVLPGPVEVKNLDDDSVGLTTQLSGATSEAGNQATLSVELDSEPTADVTIALRSTDPSEGTLSLTQFVFTPLNWMDPQTVTITGANDDEADGPQPYAVELASNSADVNYTLPPREVSVTNGDDDTPGVLAGAISGPTSEKGVQASFTLQLTSRPTAPVTVGLVSSLPTEARLLVPSLVFTPENWMTPQTVTVTGVDDFIDDGDKPYAITWSSLTSRDPEYVELPPGSISLTNIDDDEAGIAVKKEGEATNEMGGTITLTVELESQPTGTVTLTFDSDDDTEGTVSPGRLTFGPADWNVEKEVDVKGVFDTIADGTQRYSIVFDKPMTADPVYAALEPDEVHLENLDASGYCTHMSLSDFDCPTGVTGWCSLTPIAASDETQAKAACEACYGKACMLNVLDCAGPAYGPGSGDDVCGEAFFGFSSGCLGGQAGRVFPLCASDQNYGRWAP